MYAKDRTTIVDRREMLRVKVKSLAEEARIIRREERRAHGALRNELHAHRVLIVRNEARATHLAYGFIKGLTLDQMEPKRDGGPADALLWERVRKMTKRYGPIGFVEPDVMRAPALKVAA